jgi:hypothetical protein
MRRLALFLTPLVILMPALLLLIARQSPIDSDVASVSAPGIDAGAPTRRPLAWQLATVILRTGTGFGSGAIIDQYGHLLTNYHVVEDAVQKAALSGDVAQVEAIRAVFRDGRLGRDNRSWQATVIRADARKDLALLKLIGVSELGSGVPSLRLARRAAEAGDPCFVIGSQGGSLAWAIRGGTVNAIGRYPDSVTEHLIGVSDARSPQDRMRGIVIMSDCAISLGDSGGPLLDHDGNLIGLTFATPPNLSCGSLGYHVALEEIVAFLGDLRGEPEPIPFDPWCAGIAGAAPSFARLFDQDQDGRADALICLNGCQDRSGPGRKTPAAVSLYIDLQGRRAMDSPAEDDPAGMIPHGVWASSPGEAFAFDVVYIRRQNGLGMVGYTDPAGALSEMRIDLDSDGQADVRWRLTSGRWHFSRPQSPLPLIGDVRLDATGARKLRRILGSVFASRP